MVLGGYPPSHSLHETLPTTLPKPSESWTREREVEMFQSHYRAVNHMYIYVNVNLYTWNSWSSEVIASLPIAFLLHNKITVA